MKRLLFLIVVLSVIGTDCTLAQVVRTVNSPFDSGKGTLRDIIGLCTSGDTVRFSTTGTITLTSGPIKFNSGIYIDGPNRDSVIVNGGGN